MWPSKDDFLIKSVNFSWKKWIVIDRQYDGPFGMFWVNSIYENNKLIFKSIEKSNRDKSVIELRKEFYAFMGR